MFFLEAKTYCENCPVLAECEDDGDRFGSLSYTLRGGKSPYDRDLRVGYPMPTPRRNEEELWDAAQAAWKAFRQGFPLEGISSAVRSRLVAIKEDFTDREPDCSWPDIPEEGNRHAWLAGEGWVVSQNQTKSVVKLMYRTSDGVFKSRLARASWIEYDRSTTPRELLEYPDGLEWATSYGETGRRNPSPSRGAV